MSTQPSQIEDLETRLLIEAIFQRYHYDFRGYSLSSMRRRIEQARQRFGCGSISMLQDKVLHDSTILSDFIALMTVQVSQLFRDPLYFRAIREKVVPHLRTYSSIKVWIAGCSSGEELYSFAIFFHEEDLANKTTFYATDINHEALQKAQAGIYNLDHIPLAAENHRRSGGKSPLSDYYKIVHGSAHFDPSLRERTLFSDHNLATDAVFAEVHLISCRNVLIYFDRELQNRAVGLFKDALIRKGFLGLGSKESLTFLAHADAFIEFSREEKLYQKQSTE